MSDTFRTLLGLSFFAGAVLWLCPEGGARRALKLLCTATLAAAALSPVREIDYDFLSLEQARFSSAEAEITSKAAQTQDSLKKLLIKENCERYIADRGRELGLSVRFAAVELRQEAGGEWLPWSAEIRAAGDETLRDTLCKLIGNELGIPAERQVWHFNE